MIIAESLTAEQYYVLLYYRIILLILYACRNAQNSPNNPKIEYTKGRGYVTETSVPANVQYPVIVHGQVGEVVKSIETKMGNLLENTDTYTYSNPRIWLGKSEDAALLGFKIKTVTSSLTGISQKEEYDHSSNLFAGAVVGSVTKNGIGEIKQTSTASYKVLSIMQSAQQCHIRS